jgi:YidC/Oxa1 family membrane protein insertase
VNPLASCLPLVIQMPVFFIMYRVLRGLSRLHTCTANSTVGFCKGIANGVQVFDPDHVSKSSDLYKSLAGKTEMLSFGLDLSKSPAHFISESVGKGLIYATLVVILGLLYFVQQKMVASRAAVSPTMSATQAKLMQYLPVIFAVFQIFFLTGLVIYYITQALFRIGQNLYITKRFYGHEDSLGRQAQAAGVRAREEAKSSGGEKEAGGMFAQAKRDAQARREAMDAKAGAKSGVRAGASGKPAGGIAKSSAAKPAAAKTSKGAPANASTPPDPVTSKRVTPPKNRPTPTAARPQRPTASGRPGAPARPKPPKQ